MKTLNKKIKMTMLLVFIGLGLGSINTLSDEPTSILWEVRSKSDTSKVAYLLGSIHIAPPELYPLNSIIMNAWNNSNALAVEINVLELNASSLMGNLSFVFKIINFTESIRDKLPPDLYEKVKNALLNNGIPEELIDTFTPLGASVLLQLGDASPLIFNREADSVVMGIDMYFLTLAKTENKRIFEVESLATQIAALETLSENVIPLLESLVDETNNTDADINKLFTAWKNGDVQTIEEILNAPFTADEEVNEKIKNALLYDRNIDMAKAIEEYLMQGETYFVVLGAGHYIGNKSVIDILKKTGKYNIRRL